MQRQQSLKGKTVQFCFVLKEFPSLWVCAMFLARTSDGRLCPSSSIHHHSWYSHLCKGEVPLMWSLLGWMTLFGCILYPGIKEKRVHRAAHKLNLQGVSRPGPAKVLVEPASDATARPYALGEFAKERSFHGIRLSPPFLFSLPSFPLPSPVSGGTTGILGIWRRGSRVGTQLGFSGIHLCGSLRLRTQHIQE